MKQAVRPIGVSAVLILGWYFTPLGWIPQAFLKHQNADFAKAYPIVFFILFSIALLVARAWIDRSSWVKGVLVSALAGHLISFISMFGAIALVPGEFQKISSKLGEAILLYLVFPTPFLGGAVLAALAYAAVKYSKRFTGGK